MDHIIQGIESLPQAVRDGEMTRQQALDAIFEHCWVEEGHWESDFLRSLADETLEKIYAEDMRNELDKAHAVIKAQAALKDPYDKPIPWDKAKADMEISDLKDEIRVLRQLIKNPEEESEGEKGKYIWIPDSVFDRTYEDLFPPRQINMEEE